MPTTGCSSSTPSILAGGAFRQRFVHAMQGIARLKGDDIGVTITGQHGARLGRRPTQFGEVQMGRQPQHAQLSSNI